MLWCQIIFLSSPLTNSSCLLGFSHTGQFAVFEHNRYISVIAFGVSTAENTLQMSSYLFPSLPLSVCSYITFTHTHTQKSLSCVRLFVTPQIVAHQAPWSMGFSRYEYWSGLPFPSPITFTTVFEIETPLFSPLYYYLSFISLSYFFLCVTYYHVIDCIFGFIYMCACFYPHWNICS